VWLVLGSREAEGGDEDSLGHGKVVGSREAGGSGRIVLVMASCGLREGLGSGN